MDTQTGELLVYAPSKTTAHAIQRGVETHYHLFSNVVEVNGVFHVRVVSKMRRMDRNIAYAYAIGFIDAATEFKGVVNG